MDFNKKLRIEGFMPVYKEIADIIGAESTYSIYKCMHGQQITLPKKLYSTDFILTEIINCKEDVDIRKIALEYDYTEKYLKQLLKQHLKRNEIKRI